MSKRNLSIVSAILIIVIIIAIVLWNLYRHQNFDSGNILKAVPADASIILRINHTDDFLETLSKEINFRQELESFKCLASAYKVIDFADSAYFFTSGPGKNLLSSPVFMSFSKIGKKSIEWSFHFGLKNKSHQSELKFWLDQHLVKKRDYTGFPIFEIKPLNNSNIHIFATIQNGVLTISQSSLLVEASIRQQQAGLSLSVDKEFSKLEKTTNTKADGSVFLKFSNLSDFSKPFLTHDSNDISSFLGKIAKWTALDFEFSKDGLMLNGFISQGKESSFMSVFKNVDPRRSSLKEVLPSDIRLFLGYNFSDGEQLKKNLKEYIIRSENASQYETLDNKFKNETGKSFIDTFLGFVEGEMALSYSNFNASNPEEGRFLVFKTKGQASTIPILKKMQETFGISTAAISNYNVDESTSFTIYRGTTSKLNNLVWGYLFPKVPMQYFSFYRNYLIFGDSPKSIESFLYDNVLNRTLKNHAYYSSFTEHFSYEENFFLFAEIPYLYSYISQHLNQDIFHPTNEQNKVLFNFYGAGLQISNSSGLNYSTLYAGYAPHRDKEPRTIWQSRIDSTIALKPALVENHYTHEKEIMVQDEANNLYLINNMGRVLWKKPLPGKILSEIYQIDYYENNKLQYLFNTENKLYLLDRNGNYVAKYPFTLPSKATNGISVFDYDNNRDYRIFLALEDQKIYLFDKSGARISGWNIPLTEGVVTQPVQFFRTSGKDYIVFSDHYRNYIMDRRGNIRVTPGKNFLRNPDSPFYLENPDSDKSAIVTTTSDGSIAKIILPSGRTTVNTETKVNGGNKHYFVLLYESNPKYIILTPERMKIFNNKFRSIADKKFDTPVQPIADVYLFSSSDCKIGLISKDASKIFLYNNDGSLYKGFPLKGTSRFSIGFLKSSAYRFNLITGGGNNYIYNYRVE
jgi:hypothetical protein